MARAKQTKKRRKRPPPRKKAQRKMRWWDWALILGGFVVAFAFVLWAGKVGGLNQPMPELPEEAAPTATPVAEGTPGHTER